MKKNKILLQVVAILITACMASCRTALQITSTEPPAQTNATSPTIDFIGFKNASRNNVMLQGFGPDLERRNIAYNSQNTYGGGFSLQEFAQYSAKCRYVVYIDVITHNYMPNDAIQYNGDLELWGWIVAGVSCFTLFPVYIPMFIAASPNDTQVQLSGKYSICLYDTSTRKIVQNWPYEISIRDDYKGEYYNSKTDRKKVDAYYQQKLYNVLLEGMMNAYDYIAKDQ